MPLPIQALPKGLVAYLDLNTGGAGPQALSDQLIGTLDLSQFFNLYKRERNFESGKAAGTSAGGFAFTTLTVPGNEAWLVINQSISAVLPLGLNAQMACAYQAQSGGAVASYMTGEPVSLATVGIAGALFCKNSEAFVIPPGAIPAGITLAISAATAFNATCALDFVRFRL